MVFIFIFSLGKVASCHVACFGALWRSILVADFLQTVGSGSGHDLHEIHSNIHSLEAEDLKETM